ncbi:DMT family transporter [Chengkuizengella axinellae]|uniref:DMT family transporter n=1 Tax=Chengkuizengella axinellae TaxID=3064388 RepID=A0ABT9J6A7_9BACL|nr:DMT family transporter [Chengkuizengella sp. 2205SS18-9]MDP5277165.1 DMT family transporter [Chengkuizengella sp. 2205SS18-9]
MHRWVAIILVIVGASSYGILSSVIKLAYEAGLNELQITTGQLFFGMIILWIIMIFRKHAWQNPLKAPLLKLTLLGFIGISLTSIFINASLRDLDASLSIVLLFQFIWISIIIESILHKKLPTRFQVLAVIIVMFGTVLAVGLSIEDMQQIRIRGFIYGFLSAITYSFFITFTGRVATNIDSVIKSAIMITASLPPSIVVMMVLFPSQTYVQGDLSAFLFWGLFAAVLGVIIPTISFNLGIPKIGGSLSAMLGAVELPAAILAAVIVLQEAVVFTQWSGVLLILLGIIVAEKK